MSRTRTGGADKATTDDSLISTFGPLVARAVISLSEKHELAALRDMSDQEFHELLDKQVFAGPAKEFEHAPAADFIRAMARSMVRTMTREQILSEAVKPVPASAQDTADPDAPYYEVPSFQLYHAIQDAIAKNTFGRVEGSPWPVAPLNQGTTRGSAVLLPSVFDTMKEPSDEDLQKWTGVMWREQERLGDQTADVMDAMMVAWLNQVDKPGQPYAALNVDALCALRGLKPKKGGRGTRGGYEPEQRKAVAQSVFQISSVWLNMANVTVYETDDRGKTRMVNRAAQTRPFVITDQVGQPMLDGDMDVHTIFFVPGLFFRSFLSGPGRQTALLSAKALKYNPKTNYFEKRLVRYLSWQWRIRARKANYFQSFRVRTLMEAIGLSVGDRRPIRIKERLEQALDTILADKVISMWQYDPNSKWQEDSRRNWIEDWLEATVIIEPPPDIMTAYQGIEEKEARETLPSRASSSETASFGDRIKDARKARQMSQLVLAEQLGVTQAYLSLVERGRKEPSQRVREKIEVWLAGA